MDNIFKRISIAIPLIIAFLIACGYIKLYFYYNFFGVMINDYIDMSEILSLFLPNLMRYILLLLLGSAVIIFLLFSRKKIEDKVNKNDLKNARKNFNILFYTLSILSIVYFFIPYDIYPETIRKNLRPKYELVYYFLWPLIISFFFIIKNIHKYYNIKMSKITIVIIFCLVYILFGSITSAFREISFTKREKYKVSFEYLDKKVTSSKNTLYIGQTKNFLFMKNLKNDKTSVYNRNNIEFLEIMQNNEIN